MIRINKERGSGYTIVPNVFIDNTFGNAPGNYVKVYIYLLSITGRTDVEISMEALSDFFSSPAEEISDALEYWEARKLLSAKRIKGQICELTLLPEAESAYPVRSFSGRKNEELKKQDELRSLIYAWESMLCRPLNSSETQLIAYFYEELSFSPELLEYLLEYCISQTNGRMNANYIQKVGLSWYKKGFKKVSEARADSSGFKKNYYAVLRSFGISGRDPIPSETEFIDRWIKEYGFSLEMIAAAGEKAVKKGGKSFEYAEGILKSWKEKGIMTPDAVKNEAFPEERDKKTKAPARPADGKNSFHNLSQHDYDFDMIEKILDNQ